MQLHIVVPTKDRPRELARALASFAAQTRRPDAVIVVDSSSPLHCLEADALQGLSVRHLSFSPPSTARQRNAGFEALTGSADLVAFIDDDVVLEPGAIEAMLRFWDSAAPDVMGASFNMGEVAPTSGSRWKRSWLATELGLYDRRPGGVAPSGWQTSFTTVEEDLEVRWLPSTSVCWRREVLEEEPFDPFFEGYSYLEDLEHSFRIGKQGKLVVVADARCEHRAAPHGRPAGLAFGRMEALNRAFIVRKHRLSFGRYALGMGLRATMTLGAGLWRRDIAHVARFVGNLAGLGTVLSGGPLRRVNRSVISGGADRPGA